MRMYDNNDLYDDYAQKVSHSNTDFNLMWTGSHPKPHSFKSLLPHQVGHEHGVDDHGHDAK